MKNINQEGGLWSNGLTKGWHIILVTLTSRQVEQALRELPENERIAVLAKFQKWLKLKEQSDVFPAGREYAPKSAKLYWTALEKKWDIQQIEYLKSIVSYNVDGTMNILPLKKTIFHLDEAMDWDAANNYLRSNKYIGYSLLGDYNYLDSPEQKQKTDFFALMNIFNPYGENNWDTMDARIIFRDMSWCDGNYWTNTHCITDEEWEELTNAICIRQLSSRLVGIWRNKCDNESRILARKDMAA